MSGTERLVSFPAKTDPTGSDIVYVGDQSNNGNEVQCTITQIAGGMTGIFLLVANNLSDLANAATARTNLGLGTAAVHAISFFLQAANNLSDLASASTARTNLGLGTAAVQNVAFFLQSANNLSDLASATTARTNLGLGTAATKNASGAGAVVASVSGGITSGHVAVFADSAGTISDGGSTSQFLLAANNLSDLANATTARGNLGLGTAATKASSASGATVVAAISGAITIGHYAQFSDTSGTIQDGGAAPAGVLLSANNLSDVNSVSTSRTNLGLGTAATHAATDFLLVANNLSDLNNASTARTNLGLGTAATKTASDNTKTVVAMISGAITSGHYAQFADTSGTLQDGGATPAGVLLAANNLSDVNSVSTSRTNLGLGTAATAAASSASGTVAAVSGAIISGHVATFSDTSGTIHDGGGTTGSGNFVLATSPTLTTPNLGTPSAINLTNATNVPVQTMPVFRAYQSGNQTLTTGTATKIAFDTKTFDTTTNFDTSTNRYTPTTAGKYQVMGTMQLNSVALNTTFLFMIYKNGSLYSRSLFVGPQSEATGLNVTDIVDMNGSTDYLELFASQDSGSSQTIISGSSVTWFTASRIYGT